MTGTTMRVFGVLACAALSFMGLPMIGMPLGAFLILMAHGR